MLTIRRIFLSPLLPRYRYVPTDSASIISRSALACVALAAAADAVCGVLTLAFGADRVLALAMIIAASLMLAAVAACVRSARKRVVAMTVAALTGDSTDAACDCDAACDWRTQFAAYRVAYQALQRSGRGVRSGSGVN